MEEAAHSATQLDIPVLPVQDELVGQRWNKVLLPQRSINLVLLFSNMKYQSSVFEPEN